MSRARQFYVIEVQLKIQQQHARRQSVALRINFFNKFADTIDMELQGSLRWFMMSKIDFNYKYVKTRFFSWVQPKQWNKSVTNSVYHIFMVAATSRSVLTGFAFFLCLPLITDQSLFTSRSSSLRVHNNKLHWQSLPIGKSYFGDISVASDRRRQNNFGIDARDWTERELVRRDGRQGLKFLSAVNSTYPIGDLCCGHLQSRFN